MHFALVTSTGDTHTIFSEVLKARLDPIIRTRCRLVCVPLSASLAKVRCRAERRHDAGVRHGGRRTCQDLLVPGGELARWNQDGLLLLNIVRVHAMVQGDDLLGGHLCTTSNLCWKGHAWHVAARLRIRITIIITKLHQTNAQDAFRIKVNAAVCCACSPLFSAIRSSVSPFRTVYGLTFKSAVTTVRAWLRGWHGLAESCMEEHGNPDPIPKIPSCVS